MMHKILTCIQVTNTAPVAQSLQDKVTLFTRQSGRYHLAQRHPKPTPQAAGKSREVPGTNVSHQLRCRFCRQLETAKQMQLRLVWSQNSRHRRLHFHLQRSSQSIGHPSKRTHTKKKKNKKQDCLPKDLKVLKLWWLEFFQTAQQYRSKYSSSKIEPRIH